MLYTYTQTYTNAQIHTYTHIGTYICTQKVGILSVITKGFQLIRLTDQSTLKISVQVDEYSIDMHTLNLVLGEIQCGTMNYMYNLFWPGEWTGAI